MRAVVRDDGEGETLAAVAARLERVAEAGAPSAAVNTDNEETPSSDDEDDDAGPPVSRAKRNDAELRVELPVVPPASIAAMDAFCSSANPLWKTMGWTTTDPLPHKSLAKDAPATRLRLATDYKARLEAIDRHGRNVGAIGHTGTPDGAQSGAVWVLPQGREANLWSLPDGGGRRVTFTEADTTKARRQGWTLIGSAETVSLDDDRDRDRETDRERERGDPRLDGAISERLPAFDRHTLPDGRTLSKAECLIRAWEHGYTPSGDGAQRHAPLRFWTAARRKEAWAGLDSASARALSNRFGEQLAAYWAATHPEGLPDGVTLDDASFHQLREAGRKMLGQGGDRFERVAQFATERARASEGRGGANL